MLDFSFEDKAENNDFFGLESVGVELFGRPNSEEDLDLDVGDAMLVSAEVGMFDALFSNCCCCCCCCCSSCCCC